MLTFHLGISVPSPPISLGQLFQGWPHGPFVRRKTRCAEHRIEYNVAKGNLPSEYSSVYLSVNTYILSFCSVTDRHLMNPIGSAIQSATRHPRSTTTAPPRAKCRGYGDRSARHRRPCAGECAHQGYGYVCYVFILGDVIHQNDHAVNHSGLSCARSGKSLMQ